MTFPSFVVYLFLIGSAWLLAVLFTRELICKRVIAMDLPNDRSLHEHSTPRGGGVAIVVAIALFGSMAIGWWATRNIDVRPASWMLGLTLFVAAVSFFGGDLHRLSALRRLLLHVAVAALWIWQSGAAFDELGVPGLGTVALGRFGPLVTVLFVVWTMNLFNFMDGMDGFAGSMIAIGCAVLSLIALAAGHPTLPLLGALASVSALGFLRYNLPPARIFMGDVGSVSLGFFVAALTTVGARDGVADPLTAALIFSPFFVDASVTILKRLARGERIWLAHRSHWYQRLVLAGWSHRRALRTEIVLMAFGGAAAYVFAVWFPIWPGLLVAWVLPYVALAYCVRRAEGLKAAAPAGAPDDLRVFVSQTPGVSARSTRVG